MTTKKAIITQLATFAAMLPCLMILNESECIITTYLGLAYAILLCAWISSTKSGRKAISMVEESNKTLFCGLFGD